MIVVTVIFPLVSIRRNSLYLLLAAVLLSPLLLLHASEEGGQLDLNLGRISGDGWAAEGVRLVLFLGDQGDRFRLSATRINHPSLPFPLQSPLLDCQKGRVTDQLIVCSKGHLRLKHEALKQAAVPLSFSWKKESQAVDLKIKELKLFDGVSALQLSIKGDAWSTRLATEGLDIKALGNAVAAVEVVRSEYSVTGKVDLDLNLSGRGAAVTKGAWTGRFNDIAFSTQDGNTLGEELQGSWGGSIFQQKKIWRGEQSLTLEKGAMLMPQLYFSPAGQPATFSSDFSYTESTARLTLSQFEFSHKGAVALRGSGEFSLQGGGEVIRQLAIDTDDTEIATLFSSYLEPVLVGPLYADLEFSGTVAARLRISKGEVVDARLLLKEIFVEQGAKRDPLFALYGLNGEINWAQQIDPGESRLNWRGGHLFGSIDLGATTLQLKLIGQQVKLSQAATLPVLDGALQIEQLSFEQGAEGSKGRFQGYLTPVSMEKFSQAVGWPVLSGQLSGMIPGVSYADGTITIDGLLLVKVFDGSVLVRDLVLSDLFGVLPSVSADVELKNLDLETLTRTFSFGRITGRIGGEVKGLRLEDWQPVSFDAWLATPADDDSRHRISQKAVDSISNLGGSGVSGALSRSFMRFFDEFGYDRLGVRCTLKAGVCMMDGVESADRGYYLVKGGGIPRIDIMGFNRRTDWNVLLSKLQQIASGGAPVIE